MRKDNRKWVITLNAKGEFNKKVSVITLRLNAEEAQTLNRLQKSIGKKTAGETLKYLIREFLDEKKPLRRVLSQPRQRKPNMNI
ncbi:hypothetical protein [Bacteroides hominis]|uniref:hypothetical protein n=1 Tax=Bacteroides hominis TaxID=2763023 RepID=UPI003D6AAE19